MIINEAIKAYSYQKIGPFLEAISEKQKCDDQTLNCALMTGNSLIIDSVIAMGATYNEDTYLCAVINNDVKYRNLVEKMGAKADSRTLAILPHRQLYDEIKERFALQEVERDAARIQVIKNEVETKYGASIYRQNEKAHHQARTHLTQLKYARLQSKHGTGLSFFSSVELERKIRNSVKRNIHIPYRISKIGEISDILLVAIGQNCLAKIFVHNNEGIRITDSILAKKPEILIYVGKFILHILMDRKLEVNNDYLIEISSIVCAHNFNDASTAVLALEKTDQYLFDTFKTMTYQVHFDFALQVVARALERLFPIELKGLNYQANNLSMGNWPLIGHNIVDSLSLANDMCKEIEKTNHESIKLRR